MPISEIFSHHLICDICDKEMIQAWGEGKVIGSQSTSYLYHCPDRHRIAVSKDEYPKLEFKRVPRAKWAQSIKTI